MKKPIFCLAFLLCFSGIALTQQAIVYTLDLTNIQHHELGVEVTFPALSPQPLVVRMPTASPGRYAIHSFAKNVYAVEAFSRKGEPLLVSRTGLSEWTVAGHNGYATFKYTLYANRADGTYAKVDNRKLHLNMPATFVHGMGLNDRPVELVIPQDQQPDWRVATQLPRVGNRRFRAPNYYYFYDSPTFVGDLRTRSWTVASGQRIDTIEMAFLTPDPDSTLDAYAAWTRRVIAEQQAVYGELPAFDYGRYTFLCAYNEYVSGDGMEHRNSTICSASIPLEGNQDRLIGTVSHEFFHCWNVERIRPASLEPFDFDEANVSGELWFAEGFTSYYDDLSLQRAGILSQKDYVSGLTGMLNYVLLRPGTRYRGPVGMSQCAPFVDAATSIDGNNFANTFISYYSYGAVLGLALDLELRRDHKTDLNTFMRLVWDRYGRTETPYHIPDLENLLGEVTGNEAFAQNWFATHIYGSGLPDVKSLLNDFGVDMTLNEMDSVGFYGLSLQDRDEKLFVDGTVYVNSNLYVTGLDDEDEILALNGQAVSSVEEWDAVVATLKIGQPSMIRYRQNGVEMSGKFTATYDPSFAVTLRPQDDLPKPVKKRQAAWLKGTR